MTFLLLLFLYSCEESNKNELTYLQDSIKDEVNFYSKKIAIIISQKNSDSIVLKFDNERTRMDQKIEILSNIIEIEKKDDKHCNFLMIDRKYGENLKIEIENYKQKISLLSGINDSIILNTENRTVDNGGEPLLLFWEQAQFVNFSCESVLLKIQLIKLDLEKYNYNVINRYFELKKVNDR